MDQQTSGNPDGNGRKQPAAPARKPVVFAVVVLGLVVVAGIWYQTHKQPPPSEEQNSISITNTGTSAGTSPSTRGAGQSREPATTPESVSVLSPAARPNPVVANPAPAVALPEPSAYTQQLLANLTSLDLSRGTVTPEQAEFWKQEYAKLLKEGAGALPAIRQFMDKNMDVNFAAVQGGDQLGASSMRMAMIDALRQIGGTEAQGLAAQIMQATANPQEIAILARNLEAAVPEQYRDAAVAAARGALAKAGLNPAAVDTSPLFEVFQKFGGATAVSDLELAAKKWNYYAPLALALLPDGAGVGSLTRMAQNADGTSGSSSRFALQMLAQLAPQYPDAAKALMEQVNAGRVPDSAWYGIASALSGTQTYYGNGYLTTAKPAGSAEEPKSYSIPSNQQTYRSWNVAGGWTPAQVQQQLALVDQMRAVNPIAARMLEGVRGTLAAPRPGP